MKGIGLSIAVVLLSSVFGITACSSSAVASPLEDRTWLLQGYGEPGNLSPVLENTVISAEFSSDENHLAGSAGCNHYFTSYELRGSRVSITEPLAVTEMWCGEEIGRQETQYLQLLQAVESYEINGAEMRLECGGPLLIFTGN
jgi:heat shock protein HslJ